MAISTVISQKELKRVAASAYEGKTLKVMLCSVGLTGYTEESTVSQWQAQEKSGGGYVRYSQSITTGSYNSVTGRYELPSINAEFQCTSGVIAYDRIIIYIDGETYVHSVLTESPEKTILSGQSQTYQLSLSTDDQ